MKPDEQKSLLRAMVDIAQLKHGNHLALRPLFRLGNLGMVQVGKRSWDDLPETVKYEKLNELVDWKGVPEAERGKLMLAELDVEKLPPDQKERLVAMTAPKHAWAQAQEKDGRGKKAAQAQGGPEQEGPRRPGRPRKT
jgi:hypothetical protein